MHPNVTREHYIAEVFTAIHEGKAHDANFEAREPKSLEMSFLIACEMADKLERKLIAPWVKLPPKWDSRLTK